MSEQVSDETARELARDAQSKIESHLESCALHYEQIAAAQDRNEKQHHLVFKKLDTINEALHRYDVRAVWRWVLFGGGILVLMAGALTKVLFG